MNTVNIEEIAREAAEWAASLYEERTRALATGALDVMSAHPSYRVSWHEVIHQFPDMRGANPRVIFQPFFNAAIKKRHLWKVLHGKMNSNEWVEKYPVKKLS